MAKCPDCGSNLSEVSSNFLRCDGCGKIWWKKDRAISEEKPSENVVSSSPVRSVAGARNAPAKESSEEKREAKVENITAEEEVPKKIKTPPAERGYEVGREKRKPVSDDGGRLPQEGAGRERKASAEKSAEQLEIEELRARLQAMEERTAAQESRRSDTKAKRDTASFKNTRAYEVAKKWGLKVILPIFLILIALITLLSCFCGLRGIYVNVDNPNEFYSFSATKYEYHGTLFGEEYVDKGTWKKSDGKLELTYKDEFFGKITDSYEFSIKDSYKTVTVTDDFGIEREYKRVSLMAYSTPQKVTVKFYINDGSDNADKKRVDLGARVAEPEAPVRNGYEFMGWYTDKEGWRNGEGEQFSENDRVWERTEYYANWKNATIFTLTGEFLVSPLEFTEGDNIETAYLRARGWNSLPDGVLRLIFKDSDGNEINGKSAPAANVSVVVVYDVRIVDGALQYVNPALKEYAISAEVNVIASGAFDGCTSLEKIYITSRTSSLTVESGAFEDCEKLTSIEGYADTKAMKALIDAAGITRATVVASTIVSWAFEGCSSLTSVTINDGVTSIGDRAFYGCNNLTSIYYTGDIAGWCGISGLGNIMSSGRTLYIDGSKVEGAIAVDGVTSIPSYAFAYQTGITSITIPDSVTSIGESAFEFCGGLTSVTIGNGVTSIGSDAFAYCSDLTSVTIPDSVTSIGNSAFEDCTGLTSVSIPDSVTSIGSFAFAYCTGLTSVTIPDSVTSIGRYAFYACTNLIQIENGVSYVDKWVIDCSDLVSEVALRSDTVGIGDDAFSNCWGLTSIIIPDSVTSIGDWAFYNRNGLTSVTIGEGVTSIGDYAFYNCSGLTEINWNAVSVADLSYSSDVFYNAGTAGDGITVTFGDSVEKIPGYAFEGCTGLMSVTIGAGVTSIGDEAFYGCSRLTSVTFEETSGWFVSGSSSATSGTNISAGILSDKSTAAEYLTDTYYNYYWKRNA